MTAAPGKRFQGPSGRVRLPACLAGALFIASLPPAVAAAPSRPALPPEQLRTVCIRGACFGAELAVTAAERERGLMHRDSLPADRGMLFVFPGEGRHGFWMKNTRIELDIVFIGADRRVVDVVRRARPCTAEPCDHYTPSADVAFALEIAGGRAADVGIVAGDLVEFPQAGPER